MKAPKINKTAVERIKTALIFGAVLLAVGFYAGDHYASNRQMVVQETITTTVHQLLSKN